jgi:hypothetical protein
MPERPGGSGARRLPTRVMASVALAMTAATCFVTVPWALAQCGEQPVFHAGQVVAITETEVTVKEFVGTYTYRLRAGGRQKLDGAGIRPGDTVSFSAWGSTQRAVDFRKKGAGDMVAPDSHPTRLASLQSQIRLHQQQQREVEDDPALTADLRAMLVTYHSAIIRWLQEQVAAMESC